MCAGFSPETAAVRQRWVSLILAVVAAGSMPPPAMKKFKPKFPDIPVRAEYRSAAPPEFWDKFPKHLVCPGKPSLISKALKQWSHMLGVSDSDRLNRVIKNIENGADIGARTVAQQ
jgi:hypothetical protein